MQNLRAAGHACDPRADRTRTSPAAVRVCRPRLILVACYSLRSVNLDTTIVNIAPLVFTVIGARLGSAHGAVGFTDAARVAVTEAAVAGLLPTQPPVVTGRGHRALQAVEPVVVSMLIVSRAASPPTRRWLSTRLQTLLVHRADATRCLTFPTDRFRIGVLDRWLQNSPRRRDRYGPK